MPLSHIEADVCIISNHTYRELMKSSGRNDSNTFAIGYLHQQIRVGNVISLKKCHYSVILVEEKLSRNSHAWILEKKIAELILFFAYLASAESR